MVDDRGNSVSALRPKDIQRAADAEDPSRARLALHLKDAIRVESQRFTAFRVGWMFAAFFAWLFLQIAVFYMGLSRVPGIRLAAFFGGMVILGIIGRELTRRRIARLVAATAVAEGICGQCCYSLSSVPTDPDGRITCPECGAAWAHERITRPHWLGGSMPPTFHDEALPWKARIKRGLHRFITATPRPNSLITPDDRGCFVRIVDSRFLLVPYHRRAELSEPRIAALKKIIRREGRVWRVVVCLPPAVLAIVCFALSPSFVLEGELARGIVCGVIGTFFLGAAIAVNFGHAFLPPEHTAHVLVSDGLCGSCLTPLTSQPVDPQGFTTCSACGATWKTSPQTSP